LYSCYSQIQMNIETPRRLESRYQAGIALVQGEVTEGKSILQKRAPGQQIWVGRPKSKKRGRPKLPSESPQYFAHDLRSQDFTIDWCFTRKLYLPIFGKRIANDCWHNLVKNSELSYIEVCSNADHLAQVSAFIGTYDSGDFLNAFNWIYSEKITGETGSQVSEQKVEISAEFIELLELPLTQEQPLTPESELFNKLTTKHWIILLREVCNFSYSKIERILGLKYFAIKKLHDSGIAEVCGEFYNNNSRNQVLGRENIIRWIHDKICGEKKFYFSQRHLTADFMQDHLDVPTLTNYGIKKSVFTSGLAKPMPILQKPIGWNKKDYSSLNDIYVKMLIYLWATYDNIYWFDEVIITGSEWVKMVYGNSKSRAIAGIANMKSIHILMLISDKGVESMRVFKRTTLAKDAKNFLAQWARSHWTGSEGVYRPMPVVVLDRGTKNRGLDFKEMAINESVILLYNNSYQSRNSLIEYYFGKLKEPIKSGF
jgi:hypothetical protein